MNAKSSDTIPDVRRHDAAHILTRVSDAYRRFLMLFFAIVGPAAAYGIMAGLARCFYRLADPVRQRSEAQCRAALGDRLDDNSVRRVAEQAFVHRAWNLADLLLAPRYVRASNYRRYGGDFPEPYLGLLRQAQKERRPVILLTAYYGPYDLLPLFLGHNGIQAAAVYRRHGNPSYDAFRQNVRTSSGCDLIAVEQAIERLPRELENGGTVAILSDHHAARRGIPVCFLGIPTAVSPAVGLLAQRYDAIIAVAGIHRLRSSFRFEIRVSDFFDARVWRNQSDPATFITQRYVRALERIVLADPSQYLWAHARWGNLETSAAEISSEPSAVEEAKDD